MVKDEEDAVPAIENKEIGERDNEEELMDWRSDGAGYEDEEEVAAYEEVYDEGSENGAAGETEDIDDDDGDFLTSEGMDEWQRGYNKELKAKDPEYYAESIPMQVPTGAADVNADESGDDDMDREDYSDSEVSSLCKLSHTISSIEF